MFPLVDVSLWKHAGQEPLELVLTQTIISSFHSYQSQNLEVPLQDRAAAARCSNDIEHLDSTLVSAQ